VSGSGSQNPSLAGFRIRIPNPDFKSGKRLPVR
jgi:hypothetical protein